MSIRRNTIWNIIGSGLPLVSAVFCIPYLINQLGNEAFGILTLVWAFVGYFSLFDLGIGRALTYQISQNILSSRETLTNTFLAGMFITFLAGSLGAVFTFGLSSILVGALKISEGFQHDAIFTFQVCALGIIPTTLTSGLRGTLEGLDKFATSNISKSIIGISMFLLPVLALKLNHNQIWVMASYIVALRFAVCIILLIYLKNLFIKPCMNLLKTRLKLLMGYSVWVWISGVVGPLMVYGDRFFVSAYISTALLPIYAIPQEGLQRLLIFPTAICGALMPKLASLKATELPAVYEYYSKKVTKHMLLICSVSAVLIYPILSVWISPSFAHDSFAIALVFCAGIWINSISLVPSTLIQARGNSKFTALSHIFELIIYMFLIWWLAKYFGLFGAACAWLLRQLLDLAILKLGVRYYINSTHQENQ